MQTVFLHGFSGNKDGIKPFADAMNVRGSIRVDLPGFGDNAHVVFERNWRSYAKASLDAIDQTNPGEKLHIIGHSHGAMVAYVIAVLYPERVERLTLICPVARGSLLAQGFLKFSRICYALFGRESFVHLMSTRIAVDIATFVSRQRSWSKSAYRNIRDMRRREAADYSETMSELLDMVPSYLKEFNDTSVTVQTTIVWSYGDILATEKDTNWYLARTPAPDPVRINGGHLAPVVFPRKLAAMLKR